MSWNELCQPCGECSWCHGNFKAKLEVKVLRSALRQVLRALEKSNQAIEQELHTLFLNPGERMHPILREKARIVVRSRRLARRLAPLSKASRS